MHLRVASSTIQKEVYDGYLKFSEQEKLHLLTLDNKENLIKKLRVISSQLKASLVDYSNGQPVEI
jgi:DNA repair protein RadC